MITLITIMHNQKDNVAAVCSSYINQTVRPDLHIFVLDRCTDNTKDLITSFWHTSDDVAILMNTEGSGFLAGRMRDIALEYLNSNGIVTDVLFVDGDCVLDARTVESALTEMQSRICCTINKRILPNPNGTITPEVRETSPLVIGSIFVAGSNTEVHPENALLESTTWTCCLGVSAAALCQVQDFMFDLYGSRRIFHPDFDGIYGGEDSFFGLVCMYIGIPIIGIDSNIAVTHIYHSPSTANNSEYQPTYIRLSSDLYSTALRLSLPGVVHAINHQSSFFRNFASVP